MLMRHLTIDECRMFGSPGTQNEVTPIVENDMVVAVVIYTRHVSGWDEGRKCVHGHSTYGRLVEAAMDGSRM
jgi:hypothetical protein